MKLHHHGDGGGPPLIILHGLLGSLDNWMPFAQALSSRFRVFRLDLRNHGHSPHAEEFNYDVMAADLAEFIRDQNRGAASVLGHSMGGKVAMRFAQLHPGLVQKLIVADMSPRDYAPRYAEILDTMHALDLRQFQQRHEVDAVLTTVAPDKNIRQFLLKNLGRDDTGQLCWKPNVSAIRANYAQVRCALPPAPSFPGPTLFVRGGKSDYIRDADAPLIQQMFPHAKLETIATAGHWVHAEAPEEFRRLVTSFLLAEP
jgi:pimeloyl-ACP methyl ester carboxylesterase